VTCRVCEAEIPLEGKTNQHVVRCQKCNEVFIPKINRMQKFHRQVTPIRAAPPGKKYVRCPCNCLLVCKATSTRIACPRQNCRRVITLASGPPNSGIPGTAIRAPVGTCRVQCAYCQEIFMFNTLTNQLAICPHCRKRLLYNTLFTTNNRKNNKILIKVLRLEPDMPGRVPCSICWAFC
jgi:phosphatidylinositol-4,5-bisphosphate 4-phosphatase